MAVAVRVENGRRREAPSPDAVVAGLALFAAIVWGALAFGAVYPWAYWPLAAVCAGIGLWGIVSDRSRHRQRFGTLEVSLAVVGLAIALQLVPLPFSWFVSVAPAADRFFREYQLGYAGAPPDWHATALSPSSTLVALLLFVALAVLLVGVARALHDRLQVSRLVFRVIGFGVALAVFGAVQKSLEFKGSEQLIYGFWKPLHPGNPFGPFINRNHFAGWMIMALPLAIAYACASLEVSRRPRLVNWSSWARWTATPDASRFLLVLFCSVAMGTALVLTGSRSGVGSFAVGLVALAYFVARRVGGRAGLASAIAVVVTVFVVATSWAGIADTVSRFTLVSADVPGRWIAWRDTVRMIRDFPVFGVGLGNYGLAMFVYQTAPRDPLNGMFMQAHNDYLQIAAEGGLLVVIPAILALAFLVRTVRQRVLAGDDDPLTYWARAGAVAGLASMAAQSTMEFSLQMPGITVLFTVLLAIAVHRAPTRRSSPERSARPDLHDAHRV